MQPLWAWGPRSRFWASRRTVLKMAPRSSRCWRGPKFPGKGQRNRPVAFVRGAATMRQCVCVSVGGGGCFKIAFCMKTFVFFDTSNCCEVRQQPSYACICFQGPPRPWGSGGSFKITLLYTFYIKTWLCYFCLLQTVTTFDPDRSLNGDRFDQTLNADYIKAAIVLCNLQPLCNRGPKHEIIQGGRTS